ncbi:MAG: ATP-dependent helicase/nuclease subunit A [Candidatus Omnitrophota bacterium]|jgi:ATP-dependent helicase/nuclease subunit A
MTTELSLGLSKNQARARDSESSAVAVLAAAGSGKTRVLIETYLKYAIDQNVPLSCIVAMTFTKKAADEMKSRLAKRFSEMKRFDLLDQLDGAQISTIHSFCLRLLKEYPIEAGLDPSFGILEDDLAIILRRDVLDSVLDNAMREDESRYTPLFLYAEAEQIRHSIINCYERWRSHTVNPYTQVCDLDSMNGSYEQFLQYLDEWIDLDIERTQPIHQWRQEHPAKSFDRNLTTLVAVAGLLKSARLRTKILKPGLEELNELLALLMGDLMDSIAVEYNDLFCELLNKFNDAYSRAKLDRALIDADDQMIRANALIQNPIICQQIAKGIHVLMVDEFQDVNAMQYEFIFLLKPYMRLFAVGDMRQSIYAFRYADPTLFLSLIKGVEIEGDVVDMPDNYRSRPHLIEFVNQILSKREAVADSEFGDLIHQRECVDKSIIEIGIAGNELDTESISERRRDEAIYLAQKIHNWVNNKTLELPQRDSSKTVLYDDIAILMRTMSHVDVFIKALEDHNIPYYLVKGRGFYYKSEITDILNILNLLIYPTDSLAFASALKSPLIGLKDHSVFNIFEGHSQDSPVHLMNCDEFVSSDDNEYRRWREGMQWLKYLNKYKKQLSVAELINKLLQFSNYEAKLCYHSDGFQRIQNVQKLKDKARQFEKGNQASLSGFIEFIRLIVSKEVIDEGEAWTGDAGAGAVKIMTVHASKGLEFPVVCLADLGSGTRTSSHDGVFRLTDNMLCLSSLPDPSGKKRLKGNALIKNEADYKTREQRESLRLFYVAMTRATEHLYLSGAVTKASKSSFAQSWLKLALDSFQSEKCDEKATEAQERTVQHIEIPKSAEAIDENIAADSIDWESKLTGLKSIDPNQKNDFKLWLNRNDDGFHTTIDFTVSEIVNFMNQGTNKPVFKGAKAEQNLVSASRFGTIFHECLQHLNMEAELDVEIERFKKLYVDQLDVDGLERLTTAIQDFAKADQYQDIVKANLSKNTVYRELPFRHWIRDEQNLGLGFIKGQIDLFYQDIDTQEWRVIDYKTSTKPSKEHDLQVQLYAHCIQTLMPSICIKGYLYYANTGTFQEVALDSISQPKYKTQITQTFQSLRISAIK